MASQYEEIIKNINSEGKAVITVHPDRARIVIANVIKLKSQTNRLRKDLGMVAFSKMKIVQVKLNPNRVRIEFILEMVHQL